MLHVQPKLRREGKTAWFSRPGHDHLVQFYENEQVLVACLLRYVLTGLNRHETCIIVATPHVLISLQKELRSVGVDVAQALADEEYVTYDAEELVASFMDGRVLNVTKFRACIDRILTTHQGNMHHLRVYGETVAVLLAQHNPQAALSLERQWNQIMAERQCSLYCACPEASLHEASKDAGMEDVIASKHTMYLRECTA